MLSKTVLAEQENREAELLLASAFEQLGYQSESATWRNAYLQGAHELRKGVGELRLNLSSSINHRLNAANLFDALAVSLNSRKAEGKKIVINWYFSDLQQEHLLTLERSTLNHLAGFSSDKPDVSLKLTQETFRAILFREISIPGAVSDGSLAIKGNPVKLVEFFGLFDRKENVFPIVKPRISGTRFQQKPSRVNELATGALKKVESVLAKLKA